MLSTSPLDALKRKLTSSIGRKQTGSWVCLVLNSPSTLLSSSTACWRPKLSRSVCLVYVWGRMAGIFRLVVMTTRLTLAKRSHGSPWSNQTKSTLFKSKASSSMAKLCLCKLNSGQERPFHLAPLTHMSLIMSSRPIKNSSSVSVTKIQSIIAKESFAIRPERKFASSTKRKSIHMA